MTGDITETFKQEEQPNYGLLLKQPHQNKRSRRHLRDHGDQRNVPKGSTAEGGEKKRDGRRDAIALNALCFSG